MRRLVMIGILALLGLGTVAALATDRIRWRIQLLASKATGQVPGITWGELFSMVRPGSEIYLRMMVVTKSPFHSIINPRQSSDDLVAGAVLFAERCGSCHGPDASGAAAPSLLHGSTERGASDWALFQAIRRGIPETGMPPAGLTATQAWQVVGHVQFLRAGYARTPPVLDDGSGAIVRPIPFQALVQARQTPGDWLTYSGAYDGWRHSPLTQITRDNAPRLRLLWAHQLLDEPVKLETSPIALDGTLFITTPTNSVVALNAEDGTVRWRHDRRPPPIVSVCCGRVNRGLAILDSTLFLATLDARMVALDVRTGRMRWDVALADPGEGFAFTAAPLAVKDLVVIGNAGGEFATRGFITALDARTGAVRWRFESIPAEGEPGNDTWSGDSWKTGGGPAWLTGSYDPALDLLYYGIGNANPDFNGDSRMGDNLYTSSVVALEAGTGRLRWHFQFTPHDEHDWDAVQIPVLVDEPGTGRPQMIWANRNGFYYRLDRANGAFLRGREFVPQTWALGLDSTGRPRVRPEALPTPEGVLVYPGDKGATNWWSPSYSPGTGLFYVPTLWRGDVFFKGDWSIEVRNTRLGGGIRAIRPNTARVSVRALEAMTGELRWEHVITDTLSAEGLFVGGLLSTAGGVVFGGANDLLLALDDRDGRRLWSFRGGWVHAAPITYLVKGRQQMTVAIGRGIFTFGVD